MIKTYGGDRGMDYTVPRIPLSLRSGERARERGALNRLRWFPGKSLGDKYVAPTELDRMPGLAFYRYAAPDRASCNRASARSCQPREGRNLCRSRPFRSFSSSVRSDIGFAEEFSGSVDRVSPSLFPLLRRGEKENTLRRSRSRHSVLYPTDCSVVGPGLPFLSPPGDRPRHQGAEHPAGMADRDGRTQVPEVERFKRHVASRCFHNAFRDHDNESHHARAFDGFVIRVLHHSQRRNAHESMRDARQAAESVCLDQWRGPQRNEQTPGAGGQQVAGPFEPLCPVQLAVKEQKGRRVEHQVIPRDVHKGMREQAPPFSRRDAVWFENQARRAAAVEQRKVEQHDKGCQKTQFETEGTCFPGFNPPEVGSQPSWPTWMANRQNTKSQTPSSREIPSPNPQDTLPSRWGA